MFKNGHNQVDLKKLSKFPIAHLFANLLLIFAKLMCSQLLVTIQGIYLFFIWCFSKLFFVLCCLGNISISSNYISIIWTNLCFYFIIFYFFLILKILIYISIGWYFIKWNFTRCPECLLLLWMASMLFYLIRLFF
jgi:hypothetical protein